MSANLGHPKPRINNWVMSLLILGPVAVFSIGLSMLSESNFSSLNEIGSPEGFVFAGTFSGIIYFFISEMRMSQNNRSYLANPLTDLLAFAGSSFLVVRGLQIEEYFIVFVGSGIYTIHVLQVIFKNGLR